MTYSLEFTSKSITTSKSASVRSWNNSGGMHDISNSYDKYGFIKVDTTGDMTTKFLLDSQRFENLLDVATVDLASTVETYMLFSEDNPLKCEHFPEKDCGPFGVLDENKVCRCESGFSGATCEKKSCLVSIPTVTNGFTSISATEVKYTCPPGYTLGEGITEGYAKCVDYSWQLASNVPAPLTCKPTCNFSYKLHDDGSYSDNEAAFMSSLTASAKVAAAARSSKSCLFDGRCIKPNICECPSGRHGSFCQVIGCQENFSRHTMNNVQVELIITNIDELPRLDLVCTNVENIRHELTCLDGKWYVRSLTPTSTSNSSATYPGTSERIPTGLSPVSAVSPVPVGTVKPRLPSPERFERAAQAPELSNVAVPEYASVPASVSASAPASTPGFISASLSDLLPFEASNKVCPPVCTKPCRNNGQCVRNDMCLCSSEFTGPDCGELRCMKDLSTIILRGSISQFVKTTATSPSQSLDELTCSEGFVITNAKSSSNVRESLISCTEGRYILEASGEEISENSCTPYCSKPCLNGGVCDAPETCKCTDDYTGATCEQRACVAQTEANLFRDGDSLFLHCPSGMFIWKNISVVEVVCSEGIYVAADDSIFRVDDGTSVVASNTEIKCVEGCVKKCENQGVCVGINTCACKENYEGQFCASKSCTRNPTVTNGILHFNVSDPNSATLECDAGFSTGTGRTEVQVLCIEGSWYSPKGSPDFPSESWNQGPLPQLPLDVSITYPVSDVCTKHCVDDCQNGGTCIAKNTCQCPQGFEGLLCENQVCALVDIARGSINKRENGYSVICDEGYFFSSGLSEMSAVCENGNWAFPAQGDNVGVTPQCLEGCTIPCQNGGKCTGFDTCLCVAEYEGDYCENIGCPNVYPKLEHGHFELIDGHVIQVCDEGFIHHAEMDEGEIRCFKGEWIKQLSNALVEDPKYYDCVEECTAACQNGGTCMGRMRGCSCVHPFRGEFCEYEDCDVALRPAAPRHSTVTFERTEYNYEVQYTCPKGFFYESGSETIKTTCQNGVWIVEDGNTRMPSIFSIDKICEEGCPKGCENGGTCTGVGKCECLDGYEGDRCERFTCKLPSVTEINGNIMRTEEGSRFLVCHDGYELVGGSAPLEVHCVNRFWVSISVDISETSISAHESCKPKCEPPCKNRGVCVSPGKCDCPAKTTGARCADFLCSSDPPTTVVNGTMEKRSPSEVTYICDEGYRFITGLSKSSLKCLETGWSLIEEDGEVSELRPNDLVCEKLKNCQDELPTVRNAMLVYVGAPRTPLLRCYEGYSLQTGDGKKEFEPLCVDGQWVITMSQKLGCVPECPLGCRNGGVCVAPSVCQCPREYGGSLCQDKLCLQPIKGNNFTVSVRGSDVFATCEAGYLFRYGEPTIQVGCRSGEWVYPSSYAAHSSLVCVPVCMPPCENGGTCIAPGVCGCNENYSGELCQNREACSSAAPRLPNSVTENVGGGYYLIKCAPSFAFTNNVKWLELKCQDGNWSYTGYADESSLPRCLSLIASSCEGDETIASGACGLLYAPECQILPPLVPNATVSYNSSGGVVLCDEGYFLNAGGSSTPFKCFGDKWSYPECDTDEPPICRPKCKISCRNEGQCTAPDKCSCPPGFTGPYCGEILSQPCVEPPAPTPNAAILISAQEQYVVCAKGYQFPSGRLREQIWCRDGEWMFKTQSTEDVKRGCYPVCSGGCLNGGVCTSPDVCSCVRPFTGTNCGKLDEESCLNPSSTGKNLELVYK
ncbi:EGF-like domain [Trinorchestia longiramus]|nr:EGF-like domain [Trinorchestia longiramus]